MKLSIVATLYNSGPHVLEFCGRASLAAQSFAGHDYEIVLVNDGSPDNSLALAVEAANQDPHLVIIDLSRNFGHHKAMMTGLDYALGDFVFLIDSDLEEEPEWLNLFAATMARETSDVVFGVQAKRKGNLLERWGGHLFYSLFNKLSGLSLPRNIVVARLMTRRYVTALLLHQEREIFMAGLWQITGFDQRGVTVTKHDTSKTTYNFRRKIGMVVNSITAFSNAPLIGIFYVGVAIFIAAMGYAAFLFAHWAFSSKPPAGWTSVMASVWLLGGLTISFLGVIGIYLSKIFTEAKQRPYSIVRQVYGRYSETFRRQNTASQADLLNLP